MAKKKKKAAEAKEAKPAKKEEKGRSITAIVIAIIVIVVIILLLRSCLMKPEAAPTQPTGQETPATVPGPSLSSDKPEEIKMCSIDNAIGYLPATCEVTADKVAITLKGQGVAGIQGIWAYVTHTDGTSSYWKDTTSGVQNAEVNFNLPIKNIEQMLVLPMKDGKACFNQRIIVIKEENCIR